MKKRLTPTVKGRGYLHYTLIEWLKEIKDILENEYEIKLDIREKPGYEIPELYIGPYFALQDLPEEEGYLIEELKVFLEKYLIKNYSSETTRKAFSQYPLLRDNATTGCRQDPRALENTIRTGA